MNRRNGSLLAAILLATTVATTPGLGQTRGQIGAQPTIPKTWDDAALATLEVPLAEPAASPKYPSADYYYRIAVRPIYKSYATVRRHRVA